MGVAESALVPFLPLVLRDRGLSSEAIGAVLALYAAVAIAAGPVWGYVADRVLGYERTLVISLSGTAVAILAFGFSHTVAAIAIIGSVAWATRSAGMSVVDSIALARLGREGRSAYGGIRLWMSAGFAVGAIAFGAIDEFAGLGVVAPFYAALCAVNATALAVVFRRRRVRPIRVARDERRPAPRIPISALPALLLFLVALFLTNAAYSATYTFGAVQIAALGGGAIFVGLAGGLQAGAEVPSMAWTRRLARRFRPGSIFAGGAVIYVLVFAIWSVAATPGTLAGAPARLRYRLRADLRRHRARGRRAGAGGAARDRPGGREGGRVRARADRGLARRRLRLRSLRTDAVLPYRSRGDGRGRAARALGRDRAV